MIIVRKQNGVYVVFCYVDNLYNISMEDRVKNALMQCGSNDWLCPPRARWVTCKTHTRTPHKNEHGPWAILHGTILVLHHNSAEATLEKFKHDDLASISRDFVVKTIIIG